MRDLLSLPDVEVATRLLSAILSAEAKSALETFDHAYETGVDPVVLLNSLMELIHLLVRYLALGQDFDRRAHIKGSFDQEKLSRIWQVLHDGLKA